MHFGRIDSRETVAVYTGTRDLSDQSRDCHSRNSEQIGYKNAGSSNGVFPVVLLWVIDLGEKLAIANSTNSKDPHLPT